MYKTASKNAQRRVSNARDRSKAKPAATKVRTILGKQPRSAKTNPKYEAKRGDPFKIARRLGSRMAGVVVEVKRRSVRSEKATNGDDPDIEDVEPMDQRGIPPELQEA
jgi:hypothetical protein